MVTVSPSSPSSFSSPSSRTSHGSGVPNPTARRARVGRGAPTGAAVDGRLFLIYTGWNLSSCSSSRRACPSDSDSDFDPDRPPLGHRLLLACARPTALNPRSHHRPQPQICGKPTAMDAGTGGGEATAIRVPYRHLRDAEMELVSLNGGAPGGDAGPTSLPPPKDTEPDPSGPHHQPRSRGGDANTDRTKLVLACMVAAGVQFGWVLQLPPHAIHPGAHLRQTLALLCFGSCWFASAVACLQITDELMLKHAFPKTYGFLECANQHDLPRIASRK